MSEEPISVVITDKIAGSISRKIKEIGTDAVKSHSAVVKLRDALAALESGSRLGRLASEMQRLKGAEDALSAASGKLAAEQERTARAALVLEAAKVRAQSASEKLAAAQTRTGDETAKLQARMDKLRAALIPGEAAMQRMKAAIDQIADAQRLGAISADEAAQAQMRLQATSGRLGNSAERAGQQAAGMGYQFQDIAVMLAAGQNPFMLAMQQGMQLGPLLNDIKRESGGVLKGLAGGFMALVNPINLATVGIIALGAAGVYAMKRFFGSTPPVKDAVDALVSSVNEFAEANDQFSLEGIQSLIDKYGELNAEILLLTSRTRDFAREQVGRDASAVGASIRGSVDGWLSSPEEGFAELLGMGDAPLRGRGSNPENLRIINEGLFALEVIETSTVLQDQADAAATLLGIMEGTTAEFTETYGELLRVEQGLRRAIEETENFEGSIRTVTEAATSFAGSLRDGFAQAMQVARERHQLSSGLIRDFQLEAQISRTVALYGADSLQVARLRQGAERATLAEMLKQEGVTAAVAQQVLAASDAADEAANATAAAASATNTWNATLGGVLGTINAIAGALNSIGGNISANVARQSEITALQAGATVAEAARTRMRTEVEMEFRQATVGANPLEYGVAMINRMTGLRGIEQQEQLQNLQTAARERESAAGGGGGGGGGGMSDEERETRRQERQALRDQEALLNSSLMSQRQEFLAQLEQMQQFAADAESGFTNTDALRTLAQGEIGAYLEHLPEMVNARVEEFRSMNEQINAMRDADLLSERSASAARRALWAEEQSLRLQSASTFFGEFANLQNSENARMAKIGKAGAIAQAVIKTYESATSAYAAMAAIPVVGPGLGIAAASAAIAAGLANVAAIRAQPLPGYMGGGYTGDMPTSQIAGAVHGQEYVFDAASTAAIGVDRLEAMRQGTSVGSGGGIQVSIANYGTPQRYDVQQLSPTEVRIIARDEASAAVKREAPSVIATDLGNANSRTSKALTTNTTATRKR